MGSGRWTMTIMDAAPFSMIPVQAIEPTAVIDAPPIRAVGSFVLVVLVGGVLLYRFDGFVDRSADMSMERPAVSTVYGVAAQGTVLLFGLYLFSQVMRFSTNALVVTVSGVVVAAAVVGLSGLGLTVVGSLLTELTGKRRPWYGLVVGAALGASAWLVPAASVGLAVWVLLVSIGIGGPTREWVHASRGFTTETDF